MAGSPTHSACRFCGRTLRHLFADLGVSPLANRFLAPEQLAQMEPFYPLRAFVCDGCFLVQLEDYETPHAIFSDYPYFSSYASSWLEHSRRYADSACERFGLGGESRVVEVGSNDGYLLQHFRARGIPVLGVEPAANVASVAIQRGVPTIVEFFGVELAESLLERWRADLVVANNVLAHVPDLNDFVAGIRTLLAPHGAATFEFPALLPLIGESQFDTIYHEHFSYFSFSSVERVLSAHGLEVFDVDELPTHGGSLRIYAHHHGDRRHAIADAPALLRRRERDAGADRVDFYLGFSERVRAAKREILEFFLRCKREGLTMAGYGAPAKANTMLNFCGIGRDFVDFTVDLNPHKQGHFLPGSRIPVRAPDAIGEARPDIVVILPWNLREEICDQLAYVRDWGGRFAARTPQMTLLP